MQLKVSYTCELYKRDGSENVMMMGGVWESRKLKEKTGLYYEYFKI